MPGLLTLGCAVCGYSGGVVGVRVRGGGCWGNGVRCMVRVLGAVPGTGTGTPLPHCTGH